MIMMLEGRHLQFFVYKKIDPSSYICSLSTLGGGPGVVVSTAAFHARVRGSVPGLGGLKETKLFLPHPRLKVSIVGSLRDREVACSASDRQGSNFESCVWRTVSSQSSHHPQEVLLAQFSLYVHKGGLKPDSFHWVHYLVFICENYDIFQNIVFNPLIICLSICISFRVGLSGIDSRVFIRLFWTLANVLPIQTRRTSSKMVPISFKMAAAQK